MAAQVPPGCPLPRVTIQFCTQCKWMLRAAYFAQELLSTFSTALGEVALQPSTGGTFVVTITHAQEGDDASSSSLPPLSTTVLWDRRTDGGFPETKELKRRVRDVVEPGRDLGHVDRHRGAVAAKVVADGGVKLAEGGGNDSRKGDKKEEEEGKVQQDKPKCEDCQ
ncbi:Rdx family-domain-containing protein [Dactylonectria macrodidyma]|uniref:Rdx family-domain-containing protein n=1 Tax=Dactylonectria macrodidyma TaxID=307937 RepID=A0A9P9JKZ7_9HYPO|nr:Rdx family-domain-containing protein [Dactylonectria macrodidyma]